MLSIWLVNFADSSVPLLLDNALDTLQKNSAQVSHGGGTAFGVQCTVHTMKCELPKAM